MGPPPGSSDPTLIVFREFGDWHDRIPTTLAVFGVWAGAAAVIELAGPHRLTGTFCWVTDAVLAVFALLHNWAMTSSRSYVAAGATWLRSWQGARREPGPAPANRWDRRHVRLDRLVAARTVTTTEGTLRRNVRWVRLDDADGNRVAVRVADLQRSPQLRAAVLAALARPGVEVASDVVPAAAGTDPALRAEARGRTVARAG